ncbi:DUF2339 domain-containing protein [Chloroflexota bacterium]
MQCPNCQRENEPTNQFCIFCGSLLTKPEAEHPSGPAHIPAEAPPQNLQALEEEVRRLRDLVSLLNERLATLERSQKMAVPSPGPVPAPAAAPPVVEAIPGPTVETPPITRVPPPPTKVKPVRVKEREWEQILGGNWLARVGVLALIIGAGFFIKFAFDNNWIGPTGRVILGILAGLAMVGLGYYWQKKYPALAQALSGGGIALLYLSIFASFSIYQLIPFYPAFGFLLLVSIASAGLALWYNSMSLAIIGILGAFITPFILGAFSPAARGAGDTGQAIQLLAYIVVIDLGVLALSTFRNWRWFTLLALLSSLVAFGMWYGEFGHRVSLLTSQIGITIIFLIFVGTTTMFHMIWRRAPQSFDQALMVINAGAYFGISLGLLWDDIRIWMGGFTLLLALFYGGLAYIAIRRSTENVLLSFFALSIALIFLTVAIPVQLGNTAWTTIAWAAEGTVLIWLSFLLRMPKLRWYCYAVFVIVVGRLLLFDTRVDIRTFQTVINERFLAFLVSIAAMYFSGYLLLRERKNIDGGKALTTIFIVAANFFSLWLLSAEVLNSFDSQIAGARTARDMNMAAALRSAQTLSLTALWAFYAVIALAVGIVKRWRPLRLGALALLIIAIVKVFVFDVFTLQLVYRIISFVGLGFLLLTSAYLYQRYSKVIRGFLVEK